MKYLLLVLLLTGCNGEHLASMARLQKENKELRAQLEFVRGTRDLCMTTLKESIQLTDKNLSTIKIYQQIVRRYENICEAAP